MFTRSGHPERLRARLPECIEVVGLAIHRKRVLRGLSGMVGSRTRLSEIGGWIMVSECDRRKVSQFG